MPVKQENPDLKQPLQTDTQKPMSVAAGSDDDIPDTKTALEDSEAQEDEFQVLKGLINDLRKQQKFLNTSERRREHWEHTGDMLADKSLPEIHIGLFGATGTGKSSLLNAILDRDIVEKRGNGEACTAFVSKLMYNDDDDTHGRVSFITKEVWATEVETFVNVLDDAVANAVEDPVSFAKKEEPQTWAKLVAVYPMLSSIVQAGITVEDVLSLDGGLSNCLGKTLNFYGEDAEDLNNDLHDVVRSTSQETFVADERMDGDDPDPSFWPLVAEVEYYLDAHILRGVVLVDLPGVQDSNAARDQIALKYLGRLDHIFVVAAAVRASDSNPFSGNNLAPGLKQILNANGSNVTLVATQGDLCLLPTPVLATDGVEARDVKAQFWDLERQITECTKLIRPIESKMKQQSSAIKKPGKKRPRSPSDGGRFVGKRRLIPSSLQQVAGAGRTSLTQDFVNGSIQPGENFKDLHVELKAHASLREALRARQEVIRPAVLRLAAIERRQNIMGIWPRRFADAIVAHTGERGSDRELPAAFCTSAEMYRKIQHDTSSLSSENNINDAGIEDLRRHIQQLGRNCRKRFLAAFTRDIRAHALAVKDFLEVTDEDSSGTDEEAERDAGIARFMLRWYSASIDAVKDDDHGLFSTACHALEAVCDHLQVDMFETYSQALINTIRVSSNTASGASLQTFDNLVSTVRWNTLLAFMRRDGVFHSDWNDSLVARMKDDMMGVWTQTFQQLDLLQEDHERVRDLRNEVAGLLNQVRESAQQDESRVLFAPRVEEFAVKAGANAESAIRTALESAQTKLTQGQRDISRSITDKLQMELLGAYASARDAERGIGIAARLKSIFSGKLEQESSHAFEKVAEKTIEDVHALLEEVCSDLRAALFRCAVSLESDISVLWAKIESGKSDSELFRRRVASEVVAQVLGHIAKSPYISPFEAAMLSWTCS